MSLASARSMFAKLERAGAVTPGSLRALGLTRQKTRYILELARALATGRLDLRQVARLNDAEARAALTTVPGIGPWAADIYLVMALRRADVWPVADLALAKSVRALKRLRQTPTDDELQRIASAWSPWRSVAARMAWHYYLSGFG